MVGLLVTVCMYTGFTRGIGTVLDIQDPTAVLPTWVLLVCQFGAILFGIFFNYKLNLAITWKKMPYKDTDEPEL